MNGTPAAAGPTGGSPWREYLDRLAGLCGADAAAPPTADLLRPPTDLLAHPEPVSTTDASGSGTSSGNGSGPGVQVGGEGVATAADVDLPSRRNQVLILLDMNGTLLYRAKKPLRAACGGGPEAGAAAAAKVEEGVAFVHGDPDPFRYYMRPGAAELVAAMHRHPRVQLAFYTSMRGINALPAARFLMPPQSVDGTDGATPTPEVYDRPFNARDPHGANSWDTTRDLPLIWSTPGRAGAGFGPANTVMVDDTPRKMRFMDAGLVVVPEFKAACVLESLGLGAETGGDEEEDAGGAREAAALRQREVLPRVLEYLGRLLEESGTDVRPFIESNPFPFHSRNPSSSSSVGAKPENGGGGVSFVQAVELVLTTGPLSRELRSNGGGASTPAAAAAAAAAAASSGEGSGQAAEAAAGGGGGGGGGCGGRSTFEGFGQNVRASVVKAVVELLRGANAAAERWGLTPQERQQLRAWSRAAGGEGGQVTGSAC